MTFTLHREKHRAACVDKTDELIGETALAGAGLEAIIWRPHGDESQTQLSDQAARSWNQGFRRHSLSPKGGGKPDERFDSPLADGFGGFSRLRDSLVDAAGWPFRRRLGMGGAGRRGVGHAARAAGAATPPSMQARSFSRARKRRDFTVPVRSLSSSAVFS